MKEYWNKMEQLRKRIDRKIHEIRLLRQRAEGMNCDEHKPLHPERPSAAKRGYGSKWQRVSKAYLRKHPLCVKCLAQGKFVTATVVDHIIPFRDNEILHWDESNFQALCKACHDKKTWTEDKNPEYNY